MKRLAVIILLPIITLISCVSLPEFLEIQPKTRKGRYIVQTTREPEPAAETLHDVIEVPPAGRGWHSIHGRTVKKKFEENIFSRKTDMCVKCHMKSEYRIFDPHNQLNADGSIIAEKCLYCHREKPDVEQANFKDIKLNGDPESLCLRCHSAHFSRKHPLNADHIRRPSGKMLQIIKRSESMIGVTLPLDYDGKIMCATCHNPHEKGVIPAANVGAKGAGEKSRIRLPEHPEVPEDQGKIEKFAVRLPGQGDQICLACHRDK